MNKDVGFGLVIGLGVTDEVPVWLRHGIHASIGFQGFAATPRIQPVGEICVIDAGEEKFFLMVAVKKGGVVFFLNTDEELDDAFGIWAAIDVVADENEVVFRGGRNDLDHLF